MSLAEKKVVILATDGFERAELFQPLEKLREQEAQVHIIADHTGYIKGWENGNWSRAVKVDHIIEEVKAEDYHALVLPGGVLNPDSLRTHEGALQLVRDFFKQHKPVAAICHAPQLLINAEVVENRKMTSYPSVRKDLENAGAEWVDQEVVVDNGLVTSRRPDDLPAFIDKVVEEIKEGKHEKQVADSSVSKAAPS